MRKKPTPELYKLLLEEIRDNPDYSLVRIAKAHNVDPTALQRWYDCGVEPPEVTDPSVYEGGGAPFKDILKIEVVRARGAVSREFVPPELSAEHEYEVLPGQTKAVRTTQYKLKDAWDAAREDAIESIALKGKSARAARTNAAALLGATTQMLRLAKPVLEELEKKMKDPKYLKGLTVQQMLGLYSTLARMSKDSMECSRAADAIEETLLGSPHAIVDEDPLDAIKGGDALGVIEAAAEAAAEVRALGAKTRAVGYTGADDDEDS